LALALGRLAGLHAHVYIKAQQGAEVRRELPENEPPALGLAAESLFSDAWER
jgi:hypothetical protein